MNESWVKTQVLIVSSVFLFGLGHRCALYGASYLVWAGPSRPKLQPNSWILKSDVSDKLICQEFIVRERWHVMKIMSMRIASRVNMFMTETMMDLES